MSIRALLLLCLCCLFVAGCTTPPKGVDPVRDFDLLRYLGSWHEIARLDHSFERGLSRVTAQYSRREDGGVEVINRGYDAEAGEWREARGKAYFTGESDIGQLKVSFFGPFYGAYTVVELDRESYGYALVSGPTRSYLWILARTPALDPALLRRLVERARALGYPVEELIFPEAAAS